MKNFKELMYLSVEKENATIAVARAEDEHVLDAVNGASKIGICNAVLVGDRDKIIETAKKIDMDLSKHEIIHETSLEGCADKAVEIVREGKANCIMKGLLDTSVIMKSVLNREKGLRTGKCLSHVSIFEVESYHKLLFVTDAAINIAPDLKTKVEIIENAIQTVRSLGIDKPKIALLAAKEKVDPKMPITLEWEEIVKMNREGKIQNAIIDGPLALDNAVSYESKKIKGIVSEVAGDADILMCPNIESGNILYKSLSFLANAKTGGIVTGAKVPLILTSRADSSYAKLISIALGVLFQ